MILVRCPDCGEDKDPQAFSRNKNRPNGLSLYCKACFKHRYRGRYARTAGGAGRVRRDVSQGMAWCPACEAELPIEAFPSNRASRTGRGGYCKPCHNEIGRRNRALLHGSTRNYHLKARYGITAADYDAMVEAQGGVCRLCRERKPEHVDHDHLTGAVRGVLCSCCNQGLGNFRDSVATLRTAIDYLETTTWQKSRVCTGVYRLTSPRPAAPPSPTSSALQHLISSRRGDGTSRPE